MEDFKQTWWDENLETRFEEFESWVGGSDSTSKVFFRNYIKNKGYKSLIDIGCGNSTEYFAYKREYPEIEYIGVDSSEFLYNRNTSLGINMILAPGENTGLPDSHSAVVFSRHVLEHQPDFRPILNEMIRIADMEAIHVFFIIPGEAPEHIGYDPSQNLYHNRYNKSDIDDFISGIKKISSHEWIQISELEVALSIRIIPK
jgi:ubiquinone/menaquinone biosynthesis C-methylase UbiE